VIVNFIDYSTALWPAFGCTGIVLNNDFPWWQTANLWHEVLSLRRAMNFIRKNADAVGGIVLLGREKRLRR